MKKLIATLLLTVMAITALASCNQPWAKIDIGVMAGPTGMGMAKLMSDAGDSSELYSFEVYSAPTDATADLANGTLDMLCLPTNTAAALASKTPDYISVISINTLGSLYLLTDGSVEINSVKDLEGKTLWASVPSSTTGPIIDYLLEKNGVSATVEFEPDHDALVARVKAGTAPIVVLPEPKVTAALMGAADYKVALNLSTEWDKVSDTPLTMGCIVVRNDFLRENKSTVDKFLEEYEASIEFVNDPANREAAAGMIVDAGVLPKLPIAQKALGNLYGSISYVDGADMKAALKAFYSAIGLKQPDDAFYYER